MGDHFFESRVWVPGPRPEVFAFLADPVNLPRRAPWWLGVELRGPRPDGLRAGAVIECRVRWLGVPLALRLFVREYDPPVRFLDVQLRGPCARWEHRHLFLEAGAGTRVEDRVVYRLPLGPLGRLADSALVGRQLRHLWRHRDAALAARFGPLRALPA